MWTTEQIVAFASAAVGMLFPTLTFLYAIAIASKVMRWLMSDF